MAPVGSSRVAPQFAWWFSTVRAGPGGPRQLTRAALIQEADAAAALLDAIEADKRALADKRKRIRSGVKAEYGDDSTEYESVGGKRSSDRKKPQSKKTEA